MTKAAPIAILGEAVGVVLGLTIALTFDAGRGNAQGSPQDAAQTPTPCETFEQASAFLRGSGGGEGHTLPGYLLSDYEGNPQRMVRLGEMKLDPPSSHSNHRPSRVRNAMPPPSFSSSSTMACAACSVASRARK